MEAAETQGKGTASPEPQPSARSPLPPAARGCLPPSGRVPRSAAQWPHAAAAPLRYPPPLGLPRSPPHRQPPPIPSRSSRSRLRPAPPAAPPPPAPAPPAGPRPEAWRTRLAPPPAGQSAAWPESPHAKGTVLAMKVVEHTRANAVSWQRRQWKHRAKVFFSNLSVLLLELGQPERERLAVQPNKDSPFLKGPAEKAPSSIIDHRKKILAMIDYLFFNNLSSRESSSRESSPQMRLMGTQ